jgi:hypothetical protein
MNARMPPGPRAGRIHALRPAPGRRRAFMRALTGLLLCALSVHSLGTRADEGRAHFDGVWDTILSCPNSNGALGYSFEFPSLIKDGVLHGEKGEKGMPGWLQLDGKILADGSADLYVNGLVGAAPFAVGQRPAGTAYGYHVDARFSDTAGEGHRVEGRPCTVKFAKQRDGAH